MKTINANNMSRAYNLVNEISDNGFKPAKVKRIKKEDGLLERAEYAEEQIILAEDNRQILFG